MKQKKKKSFPHVYDSSEIVENIHKHKHQKMPLISTIVMFVCFFGFGFVLRFFFCRLFYCFLFSSIIINIGKRIDGKKINKIHYKNHTTKF